LLPLPPDGVRLIKDGRDATLLVEPRQVQRHAFDITTPDLLKR